MRVPWARVALCVLPLLMGVPVLPAMASVTPLASPTTPGPRTIIEADPINDAMAMRESLRRDVTRHPNDFMVFQTEAGAIQYLAAHRDIAEVETDPRIIARGIVGYCQGKTVVVLPWLPLARF